MILIGSHAIKHHFNDFTREPKDIDLIITPLEMTKIAVKGENCEYLENPVFSNMYRYRGITVLSPDHLCTLKASHLCWNINWEKHMWDLQFLLKNGCEIEKDLWYDLYNYWNEKHQKNKRSDLKMSKEDFFTNAINYDVHEHDELHKILNPVPIYTTILKDGSEVELDENKWNDLSKNDKLSLIREEVMVMAYERWHKLDHRIAYVKMLKKFIISHAPIWTVIFILENYIELEKSSINYIKKIAHGL